MDFKHILAVYIFIMVCLPGQAEDVEEEHKDGFKCFKQEEAAAAVKSWAKTVTEEESENYSIEFYETTLSVIQDETGPVWYIVSDGWQGSFYYETGEPGSERVGAYLYPDYSTTIVGVWRDHLLVSGRTTNLVEACRTGTVWTLRFEEMEGPVLTYSPPSHFSFGVPPLQRDPYEVKTVEVQPSLLPGANDGLFAKRNLEFGDIIAFYTGYMISCNSSLRALDRREQSDEYEHFRNMYSLSLGLEDEDNFCLDLPPDLGNDLNKYNATLGHKLNHSFEPTAEFFLFSVHPVLGTIMSLSSLEDIPEGSEITVNYGYDLDSDPDQPEWFKEQWISHFGVSTEYKETEDKAKVREDAIIEDHEEL